MCTVLCCLQLVGAPLAPHIAFLGIYTVLLSKAQTLSLSIKNMFTRLDLLLSKLQEYSFDEAASMFGQLNNI